MLIFGNIALVNDFVNGIKQSSTTISAFALFRVCASARFLAILALRTTH
jgi:hypothetical protein